MLPIAVTQRHVALVTARHIENIHRPAIEKRVGAENEHLLADDCSIEVLLVLAKRRPMVRSDPERIAAGAHTVIALGQCAAELFVPAVGESLEIELIPFEIPLGAL